MIHTIRKAKMLNVALILIIVCSLVVSPFSALAHADYVDLGGETGVEFTIEPATLEAAVGTEADLLAGVDAAMYSNGEIYAGLEVAVADDGGYNAAAAPGSYTVCYIALTEDGTEIDFPISRTVLVAEAATENKGGEESGEPETAFSFTPQPLSQEDAETQLAESGAAALKWQTAPEYLPVGYTLTEAVDEASQTSYWTLAPVTTENGGGENTGGETSGAPANGVQTEELVSTFGIALEETQLDAAPITTEAELLAAIAKIGAELPEDAVIQLDADIELSQAIQIDKNIVIDGDNDQGDPFTLTLAAANNQRHFVVGNNAALELRNLTLQGHNSIDVTTADAAGLTQGGGIEAGAGASLLLEHVTIEDCMFNLAGGAVRSLAGELVSLNNCLIRNNRVTKSLAHRRHAGGGIYVEGGALEINDSLIEQCYAIDSGGGVAIAEQGHLTITDSTVQNCQSELWGGGIVLATGGTMDMTRGTVKDCYAWFNGGGLAAGDGLGGASAAGCDMTLKDSLITGNGCGKVSNTLCEGGGIYTTRASLTIQGGEISGNGTLDTTQYAGRGGGVALNGAQLNLDGAVLKNNLSRMGDTAASGYGGAIGSSDYYSTATGEFQASSIQIANADMDGNEAYYGGAVYASGYTPSLRTAKPTVNIIKTQFKSNTGFLGGAFYAQGAEVEVTGSTFAENAASYGGALGLAGCDISMTDSAIKQNTAYAANNANAQGIGGGIYATRQQYTVYNAGKYEYEYEYSNLKLTNVDISENSSRLSGGGLYIVQQSELTMNSGSISGNSTTYTPDDVDLPDGSYGYGGGLYLNGSSLTLDGTEVVGNTASYVGGGGILAVNAALTLKNANLSQNTAPAGYGGALYLQGDAQTPASSLDNCTFQANQAQNGGAVFADGLQQQAAIMGSAFSNNKAELGGALYLQNSALKLAQSKLQDNTATSGGAVYLANEADQALFEAVELSASGNRAAQGYVLAAGHPTAEMTRIQAGFQSISQADPYNTYESAFNNHDINYSSDTYTVTFDSQGGTPAMASMRVLAGKLVNMPDNLSFSKDKHELTHWFYYLDGDAANTAAENIATWDFSKDTVSGNLTLYAAWKAQSGGSKPGGNGGGSKPAPTPQVEEEKIVEEEQPLEELALNPDHIRYIFGYAEDGTVKPDRNISRAEAAMIFYRLIINQGKDTPLTASFSDVHANAWYHQGVAYLEKHGVVDGYEDGTFHPNQPITRAEFAKIAAMFDELTLDTENVFADVSSDHWAVAYINSAAAKGWLTGFPDGTARPNENITRAQVVAIVNRMLNRQVDAEDIPDWANTYPDLNENYWAYGDIMEASTEHAFEREEDGSELWQTAAEAAAAAAEEAAATSGLD